MGKKSYLKDLKGRKKIVFEFGLERKKRTVRLEKECNVGRLIAMKEVNEYIHRVFHLSQNKCVPSVLTLI